MKKIFLLLSGLLFIVLLFAVEKLNIIKWDKSSVTINLAAIDSLTFSPDGTLLNVVKSDKSVAQYLLSDIDSLSLNGTPDTVRINFNGDAAVVSNPLTGAGVEISASGAQLVVNSTLADNEVVYLLSGTSTNGMFKIYSNYRFQVALNNLTLTNPTGAAINIQSKKRVAVNTLPGTVNTLLDGATYATSLEDQKATLFSEGQLIFGGSGTLSVKSVSRHAICSDDYVSINSGNITVPGAAKDGIHTNGYFKINGGTVDLTTVGDGIECEAGHVIVSGGSVTTAESGSDAKGITADSTLTVSGGTIHLTIASPQGKGLRAKTSMNLAGGNITVNTTGAAALSVLGSGYDVSYCTAIKAGTNLLLNGANITITNTGAGSKGISSDGSIFMTGGVVSVTNSGIGATYTNTTGVIDTYTSACMDADGDISLTAGSFTGICSGTGCKGISTDKNLTIGDATHSPIINITNTGTKLLVSGTANYSTAIYAEPKNIKSDGVMTIANGNFTLSATQQGANAIDCDSILTISGGTLGITISGNQSKGIKSTRAMNLTGGNITVNASGSVVLEYTTTTTKLDPSYCAAIKSDADINLNGANVTITHTGAGGKGLSSATNINMTAGTVKVTNSGTGTTFVNSTGVTDSYSAAGLTCDGNISVTGGSLTCSSSGQGGKGITADGAVTIGSVGTSPIVNLTTTGARFVVSGTDYCHPKTLVATGAIVINSGTNTFISTDDGIHSETSLTLAGGTNTVTASSTTSGVGEGIESKYIYITGGTNTITASNDGINATMGTVSGGIESNDGSLLSISGGTTYVTGADAIDSNGNFTMSGGVVFSNGPASGAEEYCDVNGTCAMNGGIFVGCGSSGMQKAPTSSSTQGCLFMTTTLSTSLMYTIAIAGVGVVSFKPKNGGGACLVSAPQLAKGAAYVVYTGGTYSGGTSTNNLFLNGTFSNTGATSKKSGSLSATATVNSISF